MNTLLALVIGFLIIATINGWLVLLNFKSNKKWNQMGLASGSDDAGLWYYSVYWGRAQFGVYSETMGEEIIKRINRQ